MCRPTESGCQGADRSPDCIHFTRFLPPCFILADVVTLALSQHPGDRTVMIQAGLTISTGRRDSRSGHTEQSCSTTRWPGDAVMRDGRSVLTILYIHSPLNMFREISRGSERQPAHGHRIEENLNADFRMHAGLDAARVCTPILYPGLRTGMMARPTPVIRRRTRLREGKRRSAFVKLGGTGTLGSYRPQDCIRGSVFRTSIGPDEGEDRTLRQTLHCE